MRLSQLYKVLQDTNTIDELMFFIPAFFIMYNHTCGVSALCSTGCLQIQPKKDEMVSKLLIFVVNKWIFPKRFVAKYTRFIQQYLHRKESIV